MTKKICGNFNNPNPLINKKIINQTNFNCFNEKFYWMLILVRNLHLFILVMGRHGINTIFIIKL